MSSYLEVIPHLLCGSLGFGSYLVHSRSQIFFFWSHSSEKVSFLWCLVIVLLHHSTSTKLQLMDHRPDIVKHESHFPLHSWTEMFACASDLFCPLTGAHWFFWPFWGSSDLQKLSWFKSADASYEKRTKRVPAKEGSTTNIDPNQKDER